MGGANGGFGGAPRCRSGLNGGGGGLGDGGGGGGGAGGGGGLGDGDGGNVGGEGGVNMQKHCLYEEHEPKLPPP